MSPGRPETAIRHEVVAAGRRLAVGGLVVGSSGNLSVRMGDRVVATPAGHRLDRLDADALSVIDLDGRRVAGPPPTSEVPLHLAVYRHTAAGAIAHAHATVSTAVSCVVLELPVLHYNVVLLGGAPRTASYARFGSEELAANVVAALGARRAAALMQNHGSVAYGADLDQACDRLELLEWLCALHRDAHAMGTPRLLDDRDLAEVAVALGLAWEPPDPPTRA